MLFDVRGGALVVIGPMPVASPSAAAWPCSCSFKARTAQHRAKLGDVDLRAIMQFVLITCIILPVLPDHKLSPLGLRGFRAAAADHASGPLAVLNPFETWLMVVLIVGLKPWRLHHLQVLRPRRRDPVGRISAGHLQHGHDVSYARTGRTIPRPPAWPRWSSWIARR